MLEVQKTDDAILIGPLAVRADIADVAEFAAALRLPAASGAVPLTFPIRWLAIPSIRKTMENWIGPHPVHASQTFTFGAGVEPGRDYALRVAIRLHRAPSHRLIVRSSVADRNGRAVVQSETVLLPTSAISAAPMPGKYEAGSGALPQIDIGPVDAAQTARYAAAARDDSRLHDDPAFARSLGLDGPIVHGMLMMGLFQHALAAWPVGAQVSRLFALFARPVPIGSRLVISGRVVASAKDKAAERQIVRMFIHTDSGQIACIGEATTQASSPPDLPDLVMPP